MKIIELYILNFEEIRRRSKMIWNGLPMEFYHWRADKDAESFIEVIRHVLECERLFHARIINRGILSNYTSPWKGRAITNVNDELKFAEPFRNEFLDLIRGFSERDLDSIEIVGKEITRTRKLGDYLFRAAYHEAVHAGQFLSNLRMLNIDRPYVWD